MLLVIWVLLAAPGATMSPALKEVTIDNVEFTSIEDCDAAGRKWASELTDAVFTDNRRLQWGQVRKAPPDAVAAFTCVEKNK